MKKIGALSLLIFILPLASTSEEALKGFRSLIAEALPSIFRGSTPCIQSLYSTLLGIRETSYILYNTERIDWGSITWSTLSLTSAAYFCPQVYTYWKTVQNIYKRNMVQTPKYIGYKIIENTVFSLPSLIRDIYYAVRDINEYKDYERAGGRIAHFMATLSAFYTLMPPLDLTPLTPMETFLAGLHNSLFAGGYTWLTSAITCYQDIYNISSIYNISQSTWWEMGYECIFGYVWGTVDLLLTGTYEIGGGGFLLAWREHWVDVLSYVGRGVYHAIANNIYPLGYDLGQLITTLSPPLLTA